MGIRGCTRPVVIDFTFAQVTSFSGGVATVKDRASKKWGVIDKLGRPLRPFNLIWASSFADGFAIARSENGIGLLGPDGALCFELPYLGLEPPHEGLVSFETYDRLRAISISRATSAFRRDTGTRHDSRKASRRFPRRST
jgi:hypothetical protein